MALLDKIKHFVGGHPYESAAGIFAIGVVLIFVFKKSPTSNVSSGSSDAAAYYAANAASVNSANQLAAVQAQLQAQSGASANALTAQQTNDAAQVSIAQIQAQTAQTTSADQLQAALATIQGQVSTTNTAATLNAGVSTAQINAGVSQFATQASTDVSLQQINSVSTLADILAATGKGGGITASGGGITVAGPSAPAGNPVTDEVTALYSSVLGRAPDQAGLDYWDNELSSNAMTLSQVSQSFYGSTEYNADVAAGNVNPTTGLYQAGAGKKS